MSKTIIGYIREGKDIQLISDYTAGTMDKHAVSNDGVLLEKYIKEELSSIQDSKLCSAILTAELLSDDKLHVCHYECTNSDSVTVVFMLAVKDCKKGDKIDSILGRYYIWGGRIKSISDIVKPEDGMYTLTEDALCVNCVLTTPIVNTSTLTDFDRFAVNAEINDLIMEHPLVNAILTNLPVSVYGTITTSLLVTNPKEALEGAPLQVEYPANDEYGIGVQICIKSEPDVQ